MKIQGTRIAASEDRILTILRQHGGRMSLGELLVALREAGLRDEVLIRSAIWHLISQAQIERDADTLFIHPVARRRVAG
jgi:DNA-binding transcriptional regulator PaaX